MQRRAEKAAAAGSRFSACARRAASVHEGSMDGRCSEAAYKMFRTCVGSERHQMAHLQIPLHTSAALGCIRDFA